MSIDQTTPAGLWTNNTDASTPETTARELLEASRTYPLGSPQHQALIQEAGVHATLANVWATEALLSRIEDLETTLPDPLHRS